MYETYTRAEYYARQTVKPVESACDRRCRLMEESLAHAAEVAARPEPLDDVPWVLPELPDIYIEETLF